jgi:hypothetical protein
MNFTLAHSNICRIRDKDIHDVHKPCPRNYMTSIYQAAKVATELGQEAQHSGRYAWVMIVIIRKPCELPEAAW